MSSVLLRFFTAVCLALLLKVDHHPKMTRYAAENYSLREENRLLRSLESVMKAEEISAQVSAELEEVFQKESESLTGGKGVVLLIMKSSKRTCRSEYCLRSVSLLTCSTDCTVSSGAGTEAGSAATMEKLNAKLLQKQSDLTAALQAFEEYKDITK